MKKWIALFSLSAFPVLLQATDCLNTVEIGDNTESCATLYTRCSAHSSEVEGGSVCTGNSMQFRVVYASTCGPNNNESCGSDYSDWTTYTHTCPCNTRDYAKVRNVCRVVYGNTDFNAYLAGEACYL